MLHKVQQLAQPHKVQAGLEPQNMANRPRREQPRQEPPSMVSRPRKEQPQQEPPSMVSRPRKEQPQRKDCPRCTDWRWQVLREPQHAAEERVRDGHNDPQQPLLTRPQRLLRKEGYSYCS